MPNNEEPDDDHDNASDSDASAGKAVSDVISKLTGSMKSIHKIRLGRGLVGGLGTVFTASMLVLGVMAYALAAVKAPWAALLGIPVTVVVVAIIYVRSMFRAAKEFPGQALTEGMEIIAYRQQEFEIQSRTWRLPSAVVQSDPEPPAIDRATDNLPNDKNIQTELENR